jgi:outer membrane protein OmpA-like peptidoglycan-associated protein
VLKPENNLPVGIDAIGISESERHIEIKLNEADLVKSNMVVTKLDKNVNSVYSEFGPLLSPDGKTLYFSRRYDPNNLGGTKDLEDIWYSEWNEETQKWDEAKNMGVPLNNKEPNFINSISPDGNTILLGNSYLPNGKMSGGTSISYRNASGWSFPKRLEIEEEENLNEKTSFFLSNSQKVLIMSVERRKENYGNRDLYVSFMKDDSTWTKPLNLGPNVNTLGTESAPFLASDDRTLYFTSDGFAGYGGSDIYVTKRLDDTWQKWSEPENLGPVVNTSFNESFFTISAFGNKMYYTSEGANEGDIDIYTLSLPSTMRPFPVVFVRGKVLDSKTMEPLPMAKILFENLETGLEMGIARSSPNTGEFAIVMPFGNNYGYLAEKEGYVSVHAHMDLAALKEYGEVQTDLYLTPIEVGQTIVLHNVFFDFGKYKLRKESFLELNRIVKLLTSNPNMKIEVSGHTDNVGETSYNDLLSFNRAKAVTHYLLSKSKIETERIVSVHYGEQNPVADNATAKGRQLNRRVEFKIMSK